MIVESRCAIRIVICVPAFDTSRMVVVISSSVNESNAEVASSNSNSFGFRSSALAIDRRCFSPPDNFKPPSPIYRDWETDRKSTRLNSSHRL